MEIPYTDEFNRQGTVYYINDHTVAEPISYCAESDESDSMSTCSSRSAITITSSEVSDFYQEKFGRVFSVDDNLPVVLPIDGPEQERLYKQHRFLQLLLGSNYFGPFRDMMYRVPNPRVLDVGTQEGTWVQEVAEEFPHAHFTSLDVVPMIPHVPRSNITFEVYDLYAGLAEPDESFDVIHARDCLDSIKNFDMLLREFHRVLKPGGLLLIGEFGRQAYEVWDTNVPATVSAPNIQRGLEVVREAISAQGVMLDVLPRITGWLEPDSELWQDDSGMRSTGSSPMTPPAGLPPQMLGMLGRKKGFHGITENVAHIPNGIWPTDPVLRQVGALAQSVWKEAWLGLVPLLLGHSVAPEEVKRILDGAIRELCDPEVRTVWKYTMIHCFKI